MDPFDSKPIHDPVLESQRLDAGNTVKTTTCYMGSSAGSFFAPARLPQNLYCLVIS